MVGATGIRVDGSHRSRLNGGRAVVTTILLGAGLYNASWQPVTRQYAADSRALFPGKSQECSIARPSFLPKISSGGVVGIADRLPQETNDAAHLPAGDPRPVATATPSH